MQNAISTRCREKRSSPRQHWLDYAEDKFGRKLVNETKVLLKILVLYIPLPLFWALFDQQGSRWTLQATRMNGDIGFYNIKPDQMQTINPFLILVFIPLYDSVFYPLLARAGIRRPLQKLTAGGVLASLSFLISGFVELALERTLPTLPSSGQAHLRLFNSLPCDYRAITDIPNHEFFVIPQMDMVFKDVKIESQTGDARFAFQFTSVIDQHPECPHIIEGSINIVGGDSKSVFIAGLNRNDEDVYQDDPRKGRKPLVRLLVNPLSPVMNFSVVHTDTGSSLIANTADRRLHSLEAGGYDVIFSDRKAFSFKVAAGSVSTAIVRISNDQFAHKVIEVTKANSMSILWQSPQYIIMTLG